LTWAARDNDAVTPAGGRRVHTLFLSAAGGTGADTAVHLSLARAFDRTRVRVSAAASRDEPPGRSAAELFAAIPDVTLHRLDLGSRVGHRQGVARVGAAVGNLRALESLARLARWCRANAVDVIHVTERPRQASFGILLARMAGCACVIHAHITHQAHDATRFANWRLHQADAVIGVSEFTARSYARYGGVPAERLFAVHNAVDADIFTPPAAGSTARDAMRQSLGLPLDVPVIGEVARLMRWKGQEILLEAVASLRGRLPGTRVVLAGDSSDAAPDGQGTYRDYIVRRAHELGLGDDVLLPGFLPTARMPDLYAALDVAAHPAFEEPFGLAVVEAMATETPTVAAAGGGIPEIIRPDVDGCLVPVADPTALAEALARVLLDPELARTLGRAGRTRVVEAFSPALQAERVLAVYETVLARRRRRSG
jgi:glycosyltransferase involved in cell wall biosynthesis